MTNIKLNNIDIMPKTIIVFPLQLYVPMSDAFTGSCPPPGNTYPRERLSTFHFVAQTFF